VPAPRDTRDDFPADLLDSCRLDDSDTCEMDRIRIHLAGVQLPVAAGMFNLRWMAYAHAGQLERVDVVRPTVHFRGAADVFNGSWVDYCRRSSVDGKRMDSSAMQLRSPAQLSERL
jgi:hypothetical protein